MNDKPKKTNINFARSGGEWTVGGKPAKDYKSDFPEKTGPYDIEMSVGTPTGLYEFTEDPIWIRKIADDSDQECPTSFECGDIFSYELKGKSMLILHNKNDEESATQYRYQLNVWDKHNKEYVNIDPVLTNGGRGT
jgi:hypothetical protein